MLNHRCTFTFTVTNIVRKYSIASRRSQSRKETQIITFLAFCNELTMAYYTGEEKKRTSPAPPQTICTTNDDNSIL